MIAGGTLAILTVLNVIQETAWLNKVVWVALGALALWFVVTAVMRMMISRKNKSRKP